MSAAKKGSKLPANGSSRKRKELGLHVIDYEPTSPTIRVEEEKARRRRGFRAALWLIAAMIVIGLGWVTWHEALEKNSQFLLKSVVVNTQGTLTRQQIVSATGLTEDTNLLTMNLREVRAKIERLPQVKSAAIYRDYHGKLTLDVVQRIPVAWIECPKLKLFAARSGQGCLIDAEGAPVPCEVITKEYLALPTIRFPDLSEALFGKPVPDLQVHVVLRLMEKLRARDEDSRAALEVIEIPNAWSLVAHLGGDMQISFGIDDLDLQLARYDRFMHEARARHWRVATLNLLARSNTPATFHEPPDVAGLTLVDTAVITPTR